MFGLVVSGTEGLLVCLERAPERPVAAALRDPGAVAFVPALRVELPPWNCHLTAPELDHIITTTHWARIIATLDHLRLFVTSPLLAGDTSFSVISPTTSLSFKCQPPVLIHSIFICPSHHHHLPLSFSFYTPSPFPCSCRFLGPF